MNFTTFREHFVFWRGHFDEHFVFAWRQPCQDDCAVPACIGPPPWQIIDADMEVPSTRGDIGRAGAEDGQDAEVLGAIGMIATPLVVSGLARG